jgi:hypothetical protein
MSQQDYSVEIQDRKKKESTYIASTQAKLERGGVIAWLCIQTIRINIAFFSTG